MTVLYSLITVHPTIDTFYAFDCNSEVNSIIFCIAFWHLLLSYKYFILALYPKVIMKYIGLLWNNFEEDEGYYIGLLWNNFHYKLILVVTNYNGRIPKYSCANFLLNSKASWNWVTIFIEKFSLASFCIRHILELLSYNKNYHNTF
jgi:hypothetical protein